MQKVVYKCLHHLSLIKSQLGVSYSFLVTARTGEVLPCFRSMGWR
ncbi:MAG TPA: hypothetical protein PKA00_18580 [Saprospiraceae bacterium]|nr:hypothetical protein [Saprospiraceae bacterium]HMQ84926.1 hypothetical protein [Saprospiraceae bacterium]